MSTSNRCSNSAACGQSMLRARAALERTQQARPAFAVIASPIVTRFIDALARGDVFDMRPATMNSGPGMLTFLDGQLVNTPEKIHADGVLPQRE